METSIALSECQKVSNYVITIIGDGLKKNCIGTVGFYPKGPEPYSIAEHEGQFLLQTGRLSLRLPDAIACSQLGGLVDT